jgi:DNA polymerase V
MKRFSHGGRRPGAGRPKGIATKPVRVPIAIAEEVAALAKAGAFSLPLYYGRVQAGIPLPADEAVDDTVNLFRYLIPTPEESFLVRTDGDSMIDAGIQPGALLTVERTSEPRHGQIVVAAVDGMLTVKRLHKRKGETLLMSENEKKKYPPIVITPQMHITVWGVVRGAITLF